MTESISRKTLFRWTGWFALAMMRCCSA